MLGESEISLVPSLSEVEQELEDEKKEGGGSEAVLDDPEQPIAAFEEFCLHTTALTWISSWFQCLASCQKLETVTSRLQWFGILLCMDKSMSLIILIVFTDQGYIRKVVVPL